MFNWLRRKKGEPQGSGELLGDVVLSLDKGGWTMRSEVPRPLLSIALFLYLERMLIVSGPRHAELVCQGLERGVGKLMKYEADEMFPTRHLRQTVFRDWLGGLVESSPEPWSATLTLVRRRDPRWPGGAFYHADTRFSSDDFGDDEGLGLLTSSLVAFYEAVFPLDNLEVSNYLMRTLQNLLLFFQANGLPDEARLGRATNVATLQYFGLETQPEDEVLAAFGDYLAGRAARSSVET
ncbi:MAG: hypothetical protein PVF51_01705 [Nitrospirota bacterium]|jgi:hypothetical protein